jgi:hypothetical protein
VPTRKQRRREAKAKRHDYEFVYVDDEGNEVEPLPEELEEARADRPERRNGATPKPAARKAQRARSGRTPPPPTWRRSFKRAGLLGIVVFALFALGARGKTGGYASAAGLAVLYTALFVPFTYAIDRFAYRRWEARQSSTGQAKKR